MTSQQQLLRPINLVGFINQRVEVRIADGSSAIEGRLLRYHVGQNMLLKVGNRVALVRGFLVASVGVKREAV